MWLPTPESTISPSTIPTISNHAAPDHPDDWLCYFLRRSADISIGVEHVNWPDLLRLAHRHGVAPLRYHRLNSAGLQEHVPPDIFQALHQSYHRNAARTMREKLLSINFREGLTKTIDWYTQYTQKNIA